MFGPSKTGSLNLLSAILSKCVSDLENFFLNNTSLLCPVKEVSVN